MHRGRADVWDDTRQRCVRLSWQNDQHADGAAVIGQLDHLVLQALRGGGYTWQRVKVKDVKGSKIIFVTMWKESITD